MMIELPYRALFFDTSFWIALMYLKDEEHQKSEQFSIQSLKQTFHFIQRLMSLVKRSQPFDISGEMAII